MEKLRENANRVHQLTGLVLSPHYGASKLRWCLENLREVRTFVSDAPNDVVIFSAALPQALASLVGAEAGWAISSFGSMLAAIVITPFVAAATVLLYLDLRVRAEGLDLELDAIDVFDRAG